MNFCQNFYTDRGISQILHILNLKASVGYIKPISLCGTQHKQSTEIFHVFNLALNGNVMEKLPQCVQLYFLDNFSFVLTSVIRKYRFK